MSWLGEQSHCGEVVVAASRRANIAKSDPGEDWFVGFGKDESCHFEGTWADMVSVAMQILNHPLSKDLK